ncbi:MAG: response regulator [Fibrobacterota bacterium]
MRILCVEDENMDRKLYEEYLGRELPEDDTVKTAASAEEAIDILKNEAFDVIISDLVLPDRSGIDLLSFSKNDNPSVEVIIVTGKGSLKTAVEAMKKGARDYLEKPVNFPLLLEKLEKMRDYRDRIRESEEFLEAKQISEKEAAKSISFLERKCACFESCSNKIGKLIEGPLAPEEKIEAIRKIISKAGKEYYAISEDR